MSDNMGAKCPVWCIEEHDEGERLEDRWPRSRQAPVALAERAKLGGDAGVHAVELVICLEQHVLDREHWVTFGENDEAGRYFTISVESAMRLGYSLIDTAHQRQTH